MSTSAAPNGEGFEVVVGADGALCVPAEELARHGVRPGSHLRDTVLDPATNLVLQPISVATMMHFDAVPLNDLRDPFDRFILATAVQLGIPLGTADRAISNTTTIEIIW